MLSEAASMKCDFVVTPPNVWADDFSTYIPSSFEKIANFQVGEEHHEMNQLIRMMLLKNTEDPFEKLKLIDIVQRLGVTYHFKSEIKNELAKMCNINFEDCHNDLYKDSLCFRLLRQQGLRIPCVFERFKDKDGKFKESLIEDVQGLLSLYEASFLSIRGEDILDEAKEFTSRKLHLLLPNLCPNIAKEIALALNRPVRKNMPRIKARHFIGIYEVDKSYNKTLAKFATLDFNMLQVLHQKELKEVLQWWKQWDFTNKLPYVRERIWENMMWIVGVYYEPQYSEGRKLLTKITSMCTILDDTYDNYGKSEELEFFTQAIQRWDIRAIDSLPEYMQLIIRGLVGLINEIEEIATREGKPFFTYYAKEFINNLVENYLIEVKWRDAKYIPTFDEYMAVSMRTSCYPLLTTVMLMGMGEVATKEAFEWISNNPISVETSSFISRLMDDIVSHKFEQERDHVASAVQCYMKQYKSSEEEAIKELKKMIENAWKDINEELLRPLPVAMDIVERNLNFAQVADVFYKTGDGYTSPFLMKNIVASVLKDPLI